MQYLLAKITPGVGTVRVEITADYAGNPLIETEAAAQEAIAGILTMKTGGEGSEEIKVGSREPFVFRKARALDPTCPVPQDQTPGSREAMHQLITGILDLSVEAGAVTFAVPRGNPNDAIVWVVDEQGQAIPAQKFYLVSGEQTSPIQLPNQIALLGC